MARAWLIDSRGIARKVKSAAHFSGPQIKEWFGEANRECPNCNYKIDNSDVSLEWPGLPAGVKFDPSDVELLGHLAGKVGFGGSTAHAFIDEFIPTLENDEGICYTHPKDLPGIKMDGTSIHFFHRTTNAYATGSRKRRKIHRECNWDGGHVRWHKTGTTKVVIENGVPKGRKKIMVLYRNSTKGSKPDKTNWVMHQYHLGRNEEEKDGEFVVSKVFYQQQKQLEKCDYEPASQEPDASTVKTSPRTPKTTTPHPPRPRKPSTCEEVSETNLQVEEVEEPLQLKYFYSEVGRRSTCEEVSETNLQVEEVEEPLQANFYVYRQTLESEAIHVVRFIWGHTCLACHSQDMAASLGHF
ncbi:hypothetical protein AMTR_s00049p00217400 [Amborella trichopoda]|uniref:NAC domain-containing protein n=1 Tax=Amborella trichopoda TaxID=13333 RepID=W1Q0B7_AMBTC|nr:hypothetical protein AMTR_s00049p00217400 [Amborella trichopoda]